MLAPFLHNTPVTVRVSAYQHPEPIYQGEPTMRLTPSQLIDAVLMHGLAALSALAAAVAICLSPQAHAQSLTPVAVSRPAASAPPAAQPSTPAPLVTGSTDALPPSHEQLFLQARAWVMRQQPAPSEPVQFAALDSRVRIGECNQALQFDYPFAGSRETLRVRCAQGTPWQMFIRLASKPPTVTTQAPTKAPAPVTPAPASNAPAPATAPIAQRTVLVARQLIKRGTEIGPGMLEEVQRPALGLDPLVISSLKDVDLAEAVRDIPAGLVLRSYDIKRTLLVRKGQLAMLTVGQGKGFEISVRVEAQQDGHLGEQIRLKNTESGRLVSGVVTGPNAVRGL